MSHASLIIEIMTTALMRTNLANITVSCVSRKHTASQ